MYSVRRMIDAIQSTPLERRITPAMAGLLLLFASLETGCSTFVARRMAQAPNTYPSWLSPSAPVMLSFNESLLKNSPERFADVGPPAARLRYRVVEPAEYHLKVISTKFEEGGKVRFKFEFRAETPRANSWTLAPRGTVVLLHGYGLAEFAMAPWAFRLAEDGWRCVLVDLRGHGKSTGKKITYGITEAQDMSQLLDLLTKRDQLAPPVAVIGDSYGAALALRWKTIDPRVGRVVAIAPYGVLSNAVLNICHDYARFLPRSLLEAGLEQLPAVLNVKADDLDTTTVLARHPVIALFVSGSEDDVVPLDDLRKLYAEALPGSELIVVPGATHETLPYRFDELVLPVLDWLNAREPYRR
jgi:pimeloyl-ACP methyl ester carboxylesterase